MKVSVIGGGPAGLYFSILMKKADPAHDVTVHERNAPDNTFGWSGAFTAQVCFGHSPRPATAPPAASPWMKRRRDGFEDMEPRQKG